MKNCPHCHKENTDAARMCRHCGKPLTEGVRAKTTPAPPGVRKTNMDASSPPLGIVKLTPPGVSGCTPSGNQSGSSQPRKTVMIPSRESSKDEGNAQGTAGRRLIGWMVTFAIDPNGDDWRIFEGRNTIGSGQSCDMTMQHETVSEHHATIVCRGGNILLRDEMSSNGTRVDGEDIFEETKRLTGGEAIQFGAVECRLFVI
jgi:hypothetical protein